MTATFKIHAAAKGGALLAANPNIGPGKVSDKLSLTFPGLTSTAAQALSSRWQRIARPVDCQQLSTPRGTMTSVISTAGCKAFVQSPTANRLTRCPKFRCCTAARTMEPRSLFHRPPKETPQ